MRGVDKLPAGYTARRPALSDAEAVADLAAAYSKQVIGTADYTLDDARDELSKPGFDLQQDAWLVLDPFGQAAGFGWVEGRSDSDLVDMDVVAPDPAVARWLIEQCVARAEHLGRTHGFPQITVDQGVYRDDETLPRELSAAGFAPATTFHRMRIDHAGVVPAPEPPAGVVLRECVSDDLRRVAHEVWDTAFRDHFGHVPTAYHDWRERHEAKSTFDWSQLWVAELDGRAVGVLECTDQFVEGDDCGYIAEVGVLAEARGRGLAKFLLRHAFAVDSAAGRVGTILHVDSNNTTPALGVYQAVGMRTVLVIDAWCQVLRVG